MSKVPRSARTTREADCLLWRNDVPSVERCRELLMERRMLLRQTLPPRRMARFDAKRRRLFTGHDTQHRTPAARRWRLRLRLKRRTQQAITP